MRTCQSSVATLLLLVIYLTTKLDRVNGRIVKWRSVPSQQTAPTENNDNQRDLQRRKIVPVVLDRQVDQSELTVVNMDDLKGVEDIEDAIFAIGYEPQKVNTKKKRKSEIHSDSEVSSSRATIATPQEVDLLYYEVPKAKKTIITPQYPAKHSAASVQKLNTSELEYVYPITPIRQTKQRFSKLQYLNPTPPERPRSETPVTPKVRSQRRPFFPTESPRPRPFAMPELSTTLTPNIQSSTITSRRGKSRSKVRQPVVKATSRPETSQTDDSNNYPVIDTSKAVNAIRNESRRKARRLIAKPDAAQRHLSKPTTIAASQEGGLEKSAEEGAALTRRANNGNHWSALKGTGGEPNSLSEVTEPGKSRITSLNRRLYERKSNKQRPSVQVIRNHPPVITGRTRPVEFQSFKVDTPVTYTTARPVAREESSVRPVQVDYSPVGTLSVTPAGLDGYQNIEPPIVTVYSSSLSSTIAPLTSPAAYSSNSVLYSLEASTATPLRDYKDSSPSPWSAKQEDRDVDGVLGIVEQVDRAADAPNFLITQTESREVESKDQKEDRYQRQSDDGGRKGYSEEQNTDDDDDRKWYRGAQSLYDGGRKGFSEEQNSDDDGRKGYRGEQSSDDGGRKGFSEEQNSDDGRKWYRGAQSLDDGGRKGFSEEQNSDDDGRKGYRGEQSLDDGGRKGFSEEQNSDDGRKGFREEQGLDDGGRKGFSEEQNSDDDGRKGYRGEQSSDDGGRKGFSEEQNSDDGRKGYRKEQSSDDGGRKGFREEHNLDGSGSREYSQEQSSDGSEGDRHSAGEEADIHGADTHVSLHKDERHQDEKGRAEHDNDAGATGSGGSSKFEMGGDEEQLQGHAEEEGEKGKKGYKSRHEHEKANKGHHDTEKQTNYFVEKDGKEKKHDDEGGYHEEHQHGEQGQKEFEHDEKGEHQKGYNTKGQHTVHKKDEFEKHTEFFDDFHDDGETEEDGEFHHDYEMKKGGSYKNRHHDFEDEEEKHGKETRYEKGKDFELRKKHKDEEGQDDYRNHEAAYGEMASHEAKKNRAYSSGDGGNSKGDHKSR